MISEKEFIFNFSFFWKSILPTSSLFLKKINDELYTKEYEYLNSGITGRRRSFISYVSFQIYVCFANKQYQEDQFTFETYKLIEPEYIKRFCELDSDDSEITLPLNVIEYEETMILAQRLYKFFSSNYNNQIVTNPAFKGCGYLNNCYGDIIADDTLYEIKMVNRNFRIQDCKQLLTYSALNYATKQYQINNVALFNSRSGKLVKMNIDDFCLTLSGKSATFLFGEIIEFISGGGVSR
ncbi:hypothetical protein [Paenibacillus barengoltzii]|uniref:hypothetical protein n=1 Tax=Paenibacillus barengoltzii TaxID=343517 RepID=UPI000FDBA1C4|nr:hypothetical protein [Paenibacillus barengoltzii]